MYNCLRCTHVPCICTKPAQTGMQVQGSSLRPVEGEHAIVDKKCAKCGAITGTTLNGIQGCWNCFATNPSGEQLSERRNPGVQSTKPMLHRAEELINGARQQDYGDKLRNFDQIADFWNAQLKYKLKERITAEDVALCMIGVKAARLAKSPTHADSVIDIAGYIGCYDKILDERLELSKRDTSDDIGKMYR